MLGKQPTHEDIQHFLSTGETTDDLVRIGLGHPDFLHNNSSNGHSGGLGGQEEYPYGVDPRIEWLPPEEVGKLCSPWMTEKPKFQDARVMIAEKLFDSKDENLFIYQIDLDNGIRLIFDANKEFIPPRSLRWLLCREDFSMSSFLPQFPLFHNMGCWFSLRIIRKFYYDANSSESSHLVARPIIEKIIEKLEVGLDSNRSILLTVDYIESEFEQNQWKPVELTQLATEYLATNYKDGDFPIGYFVEERPDPSGQGKELVAFPDNGVEVIFDELGNFSREMDPWKAFEEDLDAGLKFDNSRSSWGDDRSEFGTSGSYVHIEKVEDNVEQDENSEMDYFPMQQGMLYRISLLNQELDEGASPSLDQLDLSNGNLVSGTKVSLTFTYEMSPPRYLIVSGANVTQFSNLRVSDLGQ